MIFRYIISFCLLSFSLRAQSVFDSVYVVKTAQVYFATGQAEVFPEFQPALDSLAVFFEAHPSARKIRITAHTDSVGAAGMNLGLSQRRAAALRISLNRRGIPPEKIETVFFGENRPEAQNATEAGRQQNRRATLEVVAAVPMVDFAGQVQDKNTGQGVRATVHFSTKTRRDSIETDTVGHYAVRLPKDSVVKIEAIAVGYFFQSQMQRIYGTPEMIARMKKSPPVLALAPAKAGEKAVLNNLFFVGDQAILLRTSEPELPKVLKFMQLNPSIRIEIAGHINRPGVSPEKLDQFNWQLSVNRAKLVYNYLLEHNIPAERMTFKGYGNSEMLFPHPSATAEQQEQNRRVEIRVLNQQSARRTKP